MVERMHRSVGIAHKVGCQRSGTVVDKRHADIKEIIVAYAVAHSSCESCSVKVEWGIVYKPGIGDDTCGQVASHM